MSTPAGGGPHAPLGFETEPGTGLDEDHGSRGAPRVVWWMASFLTWIAALAVIVGLAAIALLVF
jgi:hypothetical protein